MKDARRVLVPLVSLIAQIVNSSGNPSDWTVESGVLYSDGTRMISLIVFSSDINPYCITSNLKNLDYEPD